MATLHLCSLRSAETVCASARVVLAGVSMESAATAVLWRGMDLLHQVVRQLFSGRTNALDTIHLFHSTHG
jgi:hypothetical protein